MSTGRALPRPRASGFTLIEQLARDEAIVRSRQVAFEADENQYRFLVLNEKLWQPVTQDDLLRERAFANTPMLLSVQPSSSVAQPLRIIFGREPVDKPFVLTLASGERSVAIRADGIGHFTVEQ